MPQLLDPSIALERSQWDLFWIPADVAAHERAGLTYLSSPYDLPHLNAVLKTELSDQDLGQAVSEVGAAHRGVLSRWYVYSRIDREPLQRALSAGGYEPTVEHDARAVAVDAHAERVTANCRALRVTDVQGLQDFHAVMNAAFGQQRVYSAEQLQSQLQQCAAPDARTQRFVVYSGERAVSCGGVNAFDALGLGLLWAGSTAPEERGRGFYSALVAARVAWARQRGLAMVGLYARTTTSSPITAKQGFAKYGTMTYWDRRP